MEHPDLHKKGRGRLLMVSDFICPCHGRLRMPDGEPVAVIMEPGARHQGYWTAKDILNQLETKAVPAFEHMHPGATAKFTFDCSTNHEAFAPDALLVSRMNMNL